VVAGQRDGVGTMLVEDGVVTQLFLVRNPDKLGRVADEVDLSR
jgi:RNA polymerase sigma-70 factor (ECF subfamily)